MKRTIATLAVALSLVGAGGSVAAYRRPAAARPQACGSIEEFVCNGAVVVYKMSRVLF